MSDRLFKPSLAFNSDTRRLATICLYSSIESFPPYTPHSSHHSTPTLVFFEEHRSRHGPVHMSTETLRELLTRRLSTLTHSMGIDYCRAVYKCLRWDDACKDAATVDLDETNDDDRNTSLLKFQHLLEGPIARYELNTSDGLHGLAKVSQLLVKWPIKVWDEQGSFLASTLRGLPKEDGLGEHWRPGETPPLKS